MNESYTTMFISLGSLAFFASKLNATCHAYHDVEFYLSNWELKFYTQRKLLKGKKDLKIFFFSQK